MAIDFNDMRMPQTVDIGGYTGGYDYQYYRGDGSANNAHWWQFGTVLDISVSELLGPYAPGQTGEVTLIEFPNGYKLKISFEYRGVGNAYVYLMRKLYDNNDNLLNQAPNISGVQWFGTSSMMSSTPTAYIYPFSHFKLALVTRYYPQIKGATSPPTDIAFMAFMSGAVNAAQYDEGGNSMPGITSGADINDYYINRYSESPQPTVHSFTSLEIMRFTGDGINNFNDWLKNNGDEFPGDGVKPSGGGGGGEPAGSDDNSEPGGGGGNYDDESDPVDFPELPTGGALECGAILAHRVAKQTLEVIFTKLWSTGLIASWLKSIEDPMDAIVSLHALPVSPEVVDDPNNIYVGNLNMGVSSPLVTSQYVEVDCGTLNLKEYWGSALDYSPYTRVEIFLPFIGMRTLRTEDVMKSTIHIKYHIDVLTGDCVAFIKCGISVLYAYNGNCKMTIPLSARSSDALQKLLLLAGSLVIGGGVAVGGGTAAAAATKAPAIAAGEVAQSAANIQAAGISISGAANVATTKINTTRGGEIAGSLSLMAEFVPYLIIHRPVQSLAKDYNKFKGYTSNITALLGDLTGYTEVEHIHIRNIPEATEAELAEIHVLLMGGVII